jgi:hypothetical protein
VYTDGANLLDSCVVLGKGVFRNTDLASGVSLTASALKLLDSGHSVAAGSGILTATGPSKAIEMDSASFARVLKFGTELAALSHLLSVGGGEFMYEFPVVETAADTADQVLFSQDLQHWPSGIVVAVRAVVTVYNKSTLTDHGYFERVAVFDRRTAGVTLVKEGDTLYSAGPSVDMSSAHSVRFSVVGTSASLLCTPSSSTSDHNNSWKVAAYFSVHKAS